MWLSTAVWPSSKPFVSCKWAFDIWGAALESTMSSFMTYSSKFFFGFISLLLWLNYLNSHTIHSFLSKMCSMTVTSIHVYTFLFLHCENQVVHLQANSLFRLFLSAENLLQHIEFEVTFYKCRWCKNTTDNRRLNEIKKKLFIIVFMNVTVQKLLEKVKICSPFCPMDW